MTIKNIHGTFMLAVVLIAASCASYDPSKEAPGDYVSLDVYIQGQVTAPDGQPIPNIRINVVGYESFSTQSFANGTYILVCEGVLVRNTLPRYVPVLFTDIDEQANGGRFMEMVEQVEFMLTPNYTATRNDVNVTMNRANDL